MKFSIKNFFSKCNLFPADLITLTGERFNGKLHFCVVHRIYIYKKKKNARKCKSSWPNYYRIFILFKFSKIKMRRQNHNSSHKFCLNIVIIHYIFPILIKFILVSDLLSEALLLGNCGGNCRVFSLVDIPLLDINLRKTIISYFINK